MIAIRNPQPLSKYVAIILQFNSCKQKPTMFYTFLHLLTYVFFLKVLVRLEHFTSLLLALINQSAELRECRRSLHSTMTLRNEHWLSLRHFTSNSYVKHYRIRKTYLRKYLAAKKTVMTWNHIYAWNSCNLKSFK